MTPEPTCGEEEQSNTRRIYLSISAVAQVARAGIDTVRKAIRNQDLETEVEIVGPKGSVIAFGISRKAAREWKSRRRRTGP